MKKKSEPYIPPYKVSGKAMNLIAENCRGTDPATLIPSENVIGGHIIPSENVIGDHIIPSENVIIRELYGDRPSDFMRCEGWCRSGGGSGGRSSRAKGSRRRRRRP